LGSIASWRLETGKPSIRGTPEVPEDEDHRVARASGLGMMGLGLESTFSVFLLRTARLYSKLLLFEMGFMFAAGLGVGVSRGISKLMLRPVGELGLDWNAGGMVEDALGDDGVVKSSRLITRAGFRDDGEGGLGEAE
jgi:hypothetical protein